MRDRSLLLVVATAAGGTVVALGLVTLAPEPFGLAVIGLALCFVAFLFCPWATIPVALIGGTIGAVAVGRSDVASIAAAHLALLFAGVGAVATRWFFGLEREHAVPLRTYRLMSSVVAVIALGTAYGLAVGNTSAHVAVAVYQVGVIPLHFAVTLLTLNSDRRRRHAAVLFITTVSLLAALGLALSGSAGGLLSSLAVPVLVVLVTRTRGWAQAGVGVLLALLFADIFLSAYRGVWITTAVTLAVLFLWGDRTLRRGLVTAAGGVLLLGVVGLGLFGLAGGFGNRGASVTDAISRPAGYRAQESSVGWNAFAPDPLIGAGMGQSTPRVYLTGFAITDVGPDYHSFFIELLANLGLIGTVAVLWPVVRPAGRALRSGDPITLGLAGLTFGFLCSALVSSPTDGHWELGLLPALIVLRMAPVPARTARAVARPSRALRALAGASLR